MSAVVLALGAGAAQASTPGQLAQLAPPFGCLTSDESLTACTLLSSAAFTEPLDVAVSPDGLDVYAADYVNDSVDVFSRNPSSGALTQLSDPVGAGLFGARAAVVSPDGQDVYVVSQGDASGHHGTVDEFSRDPTTGALSEIGCISDVGTISGCTTSTTATGIGDPTGIAISPDGMAVYVVGQYDEAVAAFSRDPSTGELTQLASPYDCVTTEGSGCGTPNVPGLEDAQTVTVSPDGNNVYVAAGGGLSAGDIVEFSRTQGNASPPPPAGALSDIDCITSSNVTGCGTTNAVGVDGPTGIAVSPDGRSVYVASQLNDAVLEFSRDPNSGDLGQLSSPNDCVTSDAVGCGTVNATGLAGAQDVAVSPDDRTVYVAGTDDSAVAAFSRDPGSGDLTQLASPADCITSNASGCGTTSANAITAPDALVVSPDNGDVYVASADGNPSALVALARTPVTPPTGALAQLLEPNNCVGVVGGLAAHAGGFVPFGSVGCDTLLATGGVNQSAVDVAVSPDGANAYEVLNDNELVEFSRDPTTGALTYLGCITAASGCTINGTAGLRGPTAVAVSPDGKSVYVTGATDDAVAEFSRDPSSGLLTPLPGTDACISEVGTGSCSNDTGYGLDGGTGIAVSSDGKNVYVTGASDDAVAELSRDPSSGALRPLASPNACISDGTIIGATQCTNSAVGLGKDTPESETEADLAISPDGANVYVAAGGFAGNGDIAEFSRTPSTGALVQLAGSNDCVTSDATDTGCDADNATNVAGPDQIAISPDGNDLYAASVQGGGAVLEFGRNASGGALTQLSSPNGCIGGSCTPSNPANGVSIDPGVAISPDGLNVYATGADDNAIAVLDRDPTTGFLSQPAFPYNCLSSLYNVPTGCGTVNSAGFAGGLRVTVSPDGANVYDAAQSLPALVELARTTPSASLGLSVSAPSSAVVGSQFSYTVTLTDNGPSDEYGVTLSNALPSGVTLVSASPSQGSCSGTTMMSCNLDWMINGHSATLTLAVDAGVVGTQTDGATLAPSGDVADPSSKRSASASTAVTSAAPAPSPTPVLEQSTVVAPVSGSAEIELPGTNTFVPLSSVTSIPMGSTIDATHGTVQITVAEPDGTTRTAEFYDGEFVVTQNASGRLFATLAGGSFAGCPPAGKGKGHRKAQLASAKKSKTTVVRQLWGSGHGNFTTKGRYGSAAVSGTIWLTQDLCEGTYFKVTQDTIVVTANAHASKHRKLKQGQHYLVLAPGF